MSLEAGSRLGPYEIREPLGSGGMGEVFVAEDTRLNRRVAVKVLPESFAGDAGRLARFEQEAKAAAALNHPHIAAVFDVGEEGGVHFMVQELLDGSTLRDQLGGPLVLSRALPLAIEMAQALNAAHKAGIVHRDLKPENVFVTEDGHAKVLDFGLAKLTEVGSGPGSEASMSPTMLGTAAGEVMGTAGYMAPEQAQGSEVDHRADLFAFGCVLYEMATGRQPFAGKNVYDTLSKIVSDEPEPIDARVAGAPTELQRIVRKCLSKEPELRYQSAADAAVDLKLLLRDLDSGQAEVAEAPAPMQQVVRAGVSPALVAAAVLATALVAAWAGQGLSPESPSEPLRRFDFAYPAEHPMMLPCCSNNVAIARDGSFVSFFAGPEQFDFLQDWVLYTRRFDSRRSTLVEGVTGYIPAVSPDGEWIAYMGQADNAATLKKIALAGGAPFDLGTDRFGPIFWADDGYIYLGAAEAGVPSRIPENGGEVEPLDVTGIPEGQSAFRLWVLPERRLAFADLGDVSGGPEGIQAAGIGLIDLDTLELTPLVDEGSDPRWSESGHLLWVRAGVVYAAPFDTSSRALAGRAVPVLQGVAVDFTGAAQMGLSEEGTLAWIPGGSTDALEQTSQLHWLGDDGEPVIAAGREADYGSTRVSPDQTRVAVTIRDADEPSSVWLLDLALDSLTRVATNASDPLWSPDGEWIYFTARHEGNPDIWRRRADFSADPEPVLVAEGTQVLGSITPDGRYLFYRQRIDPAEPEGERGDDLWMVPTDGGEPIAWLETDAYESAPRVSPDGTLVAYVSRETGEQRVYVRELDGQRRWTVSPDNGWAPLWSPDGDRLYYRGQGGFAVQFVVDVDASDGYRQSPPRRVTIPDGMSAASDVAPDGRLLIKKVDNPLLNTEGDAARMNVTLNWFQELERLAPPER